MEIITVLVFAALAWLWLDSLKAREAAVKAGRAACEAEGRLFLDDTVSIEELKLVRDAGGQVHIQRAYAFEHSDTGDNRLKGSVVLLGHRVMLLNVGVSPRVNSHVRTLH
jgi:hypothetical protein